MASETLTLECRHCEAGNRIPVERALKDLRAILCGRCAGRLLRVDGERLSDLTDDDLAHPWDREALAKLRAVPMADKLLSRVFSGTLDKVARFRHLAGAVRVSDQQLPTLHRLHLEAAHRLDVEAPPLFVSQSPVLNAFAVGAGTPFVTITSALVDSLEDRELVAVLGHELTHIRLGHTLYRTLALIMIQGGLGVADRMLGIAGLLATPVKVALMRWYQMSELSADRGGLLAVGDIDVHVRTEMKLAGGTSRFAAELDPQAFIDQAREADEARDQDVLLHVMELLDS